MADLDLIENDIDRAREAARAAEAALADLASDRAAPHDIARALCSLGRAVEAVVAARGDIVLEASAAQQSARHMEARTLWGARGHVGSAYGAIVSALDELEQTRDPRELPARAGRAATLLRRAGDALEAAQWRVGRAIDRALGLRGLTE
jgi:hypothetical protein